MIVHSDSGIGMLLAFIVMLGAIGALTLVSWLTPQTIVKVGQSYCADI